MMKTAHFKKHLAIALLLVVFAAQSITSLAGKSATFDEVQYFGIGKYLLTAHKWDIMGAILHPPLSYYLNSLPLLFVSEDKKIWQYEEKQRDLTFLGAIDYYRGQELLSSKYNAGDRLLAASRLMTLLTALLLGLYVYRFGALLFGTSGGLVALFFFCFCPNMLAFSGICVPDMPLAAFSFIAVYYLWVCLHDSTARPRSCLLAGLFLGLALLSKFTAFLLIPIEIAIAVSVMFRLKRNLVPRLVSIFAIGLFVLLAGYQFQIQPFIQGQQYRLMQQGYGQGVFLMGQYSNHGWWYFYPVTLLLKTPLPLLLLLSFAVFTIIKERAEKSSLLVLLLAPILVYLTVFSFSGYSVALRYLLPIYPFIFLALGALSFASFKKKAFIGACMVWHVVSSLQTAPHYLAYFNELIAGPDNGYKYLVDSNLDWGQDLKGLKSYMDKRGIEKISFSYFGADAPQRYGIKYDWLPSHYLYNNFPQKPYDMFANRFLAISATNLQGVYLEDRNLYKWLLEYEPVAKIGYSILVYDLSAQ